MRILILNADYRNFLSALYAASPGLANASYAEQMAARNASLFGVADFYSRNLRAHGHEAADIHVNNRWMQHAWAREHGMAVGDTLETPAPTTPGYRLRALAMAKTVLRPIVKPVLGQLRDGWLTQTERKILACQIEQFRPDVILNQDMAYIGNDFLKSVRKKKRLIVGQLAAPLPERKTFTAYDLVVSSLPNFVKWFRDRGIKAELSWLAFEPRLLNEMPEPPQRNIDVSFVGSLSPEHESRIALLEYVAARVPLKVWGNGIERLPRSSVLYGCYQGEAWGRDMYDALRRSRITLNRHIDLAGEWANNMRLYEATGMGAMLLTDAKKNLDEIFTGGEQVAVYGSAQECVSQIEKYLADDKARSAIAAAGQRQAVERHSYHRRMGEFLNLITPLMQTSDRDGHGPETLRSLGD